MKRRTDYPIAELDTVCVLGGRGGREFEDYREDQDTEINKKSEFKDANETVYETGTHLANVAPKAGSLDIWCVEAQERCYGGGVAVPSNTPRLTLHIGENTLRSHNQIHLMQHFKGK